MKVEWTAGGVLAVAAVVAAGAGIAYAYLKRKQLATAVNPLSDKNVFNQLADAGTKALSDGKYLSIGGALFGETEAEKNINAPVTDADIAAYRAKKNAAALPIEDPYSSGPWLLGAGA